MVAFFYLKSVRYTILMDILKHNKLITMKNDIILANIHLLKTHLSKYYQIDFNKIEFERFKDNVDTFLSESYRDLKLISDESIFGFSVGKKIKIKFFEEYSKSIVDNDYTSYGQSIGNFIVNSKINLDDYTFLCVLKTSAIKCISVKVLMSSKFYDFIEKPITNTELSVNSLDRDIVNLNQLYFGSIENVPTMN